MNVNTFAKKVNLDADHMGHIIVSLADIHTAIDEAARVGQLDPHEWADTVYMLGNMEGRALSDNLTENDLELFNAWQNDYICNPSQHIEGPVKEAWLNLARGLMCKLRNQYRGLPGTESDYANIKTIRNDILRGFISDEQILTIGSMSVQYK